MKIFGFLFFLLKHNSRLDLPNGWHTQVRLMGRGACRNSTYTARGLNPGPFFWVPGSQNGLYEWPITPRQWSLFWVYMCMTAILGHRRSYTLHPFAPIHQFSAWHMCLQWNCRLRWPSQPIIRFWKTPSPQQHLLTSPRKWKMVMLKCKKSEDILSVSIRLFFRNKNQRVKFQ
jgi:hypothetical protein